MIELYAKGTTDFSRHGIALAASQAAVTYQENGRFDMDLTMPVNPAITIDYGMIVRCPVPVQDIGAITLGPVSYWEISAGLTGVPLYAQVPKKSKVSYSNWQAYRSYMAGDKVTYGEDPEDAGTLKNWQCTTGHGGLSTPPPSNPTLWRQISGTKTTSKVICTLDAGAILIKTGDYNTTYMKVVDTQGREGFVEIAKCTDRSESGTRVVPAQHIEKQSFVITEITKSSDGQTVAIHAEHVSYQLGRTMLGDCVLSRATPSTALMIIRGAMRESYPGAVETNLTGEDALITGDFSWKNAQSAILDPKAGLLQATGARLIRNDLNIYVIAPGEAVPKYRITYGTNMKAIKWDGDVSGLVTRIYPIAQNEDGSTLLLPEEYIDTVRTVPFVRPEPLQTGLKVGQKETQEDGSEITLDENTVFARMREAAANRFAIDEADKATVTLEVDWQHLPDTAEFSAYAALANAAPGELVQVKNGPLGIDTVIQLTGYTFDPILRRYNKGTFGKKKQTSSVASYDIQSGAVTGRAIGVGAVGSQNIQANAITAREIEANAITAEKIASRSIVTELLAAGLITADEINASAVTAEKIAAYAIIAEKINAGAVTAEKIAAGAVTADKIDAGAITADKIDANNIAAINAKLGTATIENGMINNAEISFAKIKALTAESLISRDAVTDRYFIDKLQVRNLQSVEATVGNLVVKAANNNYYRLEIGSDGSLTPVQVTPTSAAIAEGKMGTGTIIETDLTVADLSASNIKGINALIDKLTASRIDVDELFARQAFIGKLLTTDISSNTSLQLYVGETAYTKKSGVLITDNGVEIEGGSYVKIKAASGNTAAGKLIIESGNLRVNANGDVYVAGEIHAGANSVIGGWTLGANNFHSGESGTYVALDSGTSGVDYAIWAGAESAANAPFSVTRAGALKAISGKLGSWSIGSDYLGNAATKAASTAGIANASGSSDIIFWSGGAYTGSGASAPKFQVRKDGTVVLTALKALGEDGTETDVNLRTAGLWKLSYGTVKSVGVTDGYCTSMTFSNAVSGTTTVNFKRAAAVNLTGSWGSDRTFTVTETNSGETYSETLQYDVDVGYGNVDSIPVDTFNASHYARARVMMSSAQGGNVLFGFKIDARGQYNAGVTAGASGVTLSAAGWVNGSNVVTASNGESVTINLPAITMSGGTSFSSHKTTVYATGGGVTGYVASKEVDATSEYNAGWTGCYGTVGLNTTTQQDLGYGGSVTIYAQAKASSGASSKTNVTSVKITAPADNKGTGWTLAVGKVSLPGSGTSASMSVTTPGSTYNTSGATTYTVSADNSYAYIKQGSTTVARASHSAYSNGANSVTISAAGWVNGSNVVSASNGKSVTVNLPTISLTGGTSFSSHKTTVYASGGGATGYLASKEVDATSEYNAGWNAYRAALLAITGNKTIVYWAGTRYANLWTAPNSYGTQLSGCLKYAGYGDIPDAK